MRKMKRVKKWGICILSIVLLTMSIRFDVSAASFDDVNSDSMFFKQSTSYTCTLASAAMMVRRAALLNSNSNWSSVTENNMKNAAWSGGLKNSFSYAGISVSAQGGTSNLSAVWNKSSADKSALFRSLLEQHPEGIVMYCKKSHNINADVHAILLTDYTNDMFYCSDPASNAPRGRIPLSSATVNMDNAFKYWYVSSPKLALSTGDTIAPVISDVSVKDVSKDGYTVICRVTDEGGSGIDRVQFPTWSNINGQDDLDPNWWFGGYSSGIKDGDYYSFRVNTSQHNEDGEIYTTHIYAFDKAGNYSKSSICPWIDKTPPAITDVKIIEKDATGYTVQCKATDFFDIVRVQFPTWTAENGQDDLAANWWDNPACSGKGADSIYTFRVNDSDHNFERGTYHTHIYAYDKYGNCSCVTTSVNLQNTYQAIRTASYNGNTYQLFNDCLTWDEAKRKCEELGGHLVTITSAGEQDVVTSLVNGQARTGYWTGGRKSGSSIWITGEPFSYTNWDINQPDALNGEDRYGIYSSTGKWNDWLNTNRYLGFICEKEAKSTVSNPPVNNQTGSKVYCMTFDVNNGNPLENQYKFVYSGNALGTLPVPSRQNYVFKGWYLQKTGGLRVSEKTIANSNARLYARWERVTVPKISRLYVWSENSAEAEVTYGGGSGANGYEILYSTDKKFKRNTLMVTTSDTSKTFKGLSKGKTYYFKVRMYKLDSTGKKIYGKYSSVKKAKIRK